MHATAQKCVLKSSFEMVFCQIGTNLSYLRRWGIESEDTFSEKR